MNKKSNNPYLARIIKKAFIVLKNPERKTIFRLVKEFLYLSYKTRSLATHYFTSFLYLDEIENYKDFLSHKECELLQRLINEKVSIELTGNKLFFQLFYEKFDIPLPKMLAFSIGEKFNYFDGSKWVFQKISENKPDELKTALQDLLLVSKKDSLFAKPMIGSGGRGIQRITSKSIDTESEEVDKMMVDILSGTYIYQEEVLQHAELDKLNASCANTVRIDTFREPGEDAEILSALLRIGKHGVHVANTWRGGFFVGINLEDGSLKDLGFFKFRKGASLCRLHPETGEPFEGFVLPYFDEIKKIVIDAANRLPKGLIGWDFAISEKGPVLLEGNCVYYAMPDSDKAYGGYRNNLVYRKCVNYIGRKRGSKVKKKVARLWP